MSVSHRLSRLNINERMPTTRSQGRHRGSSGTPSDEFLLRAHEVRDIFSCFKEGTLPCEYLPVQWDRIVQDYKSGRIRTPAECRTQGDLETTLFMLACHDARMYDSLTAVQPAEARLKIFAETIKGRFRRCFDTFERIRQLQHPKQRFESICSELRRHAKYIISDWRFRRLWDEDVETMVDAQAANLLLGLLQKVIAYNYDPTGRGDLNLFRTLISSAREDEEDIFILRGLEKLDKDIFDLDSSGESLQRLAEDLSAAPSWYRRRILDLGPAARTGDKRSSGGAGRGREKRTK